METPPSAVFHVSGSAGLSCTPSSTLLHVDGTKVFRQTMCVAASEQEHVLSNQHPAVLTDTPQSGVIQLDRISSFMRTPQMAGMSANPPSSLLRVDGSAVFNGTCDVGTNATMHVSINRHESGSSIANDSSDWLARNNSYIRTSRTSTNPAVLQGNTDNTDDGATVSSLSARKKKEKPHGAD
ncbi:uncharacterized protein LOC120660166 [Panicum virgatum]|nr:uncharacterized protein LOC120660166 [Panicum virgatum]